MLKMKIYFPLVLVCILLSNTVSASTRGIMTNQEKTSLVAPASGSYQWYYNNKLLSGETSRELQAKRSGTYHVTVTSKSGVTTSFKVTVAVSNGKIIRIFVIGDSTASIYNYSLYPRNGWAQVFQAFFRKDSVQVVDKALSGRSSKSFFFDPKGWITVLPQLEKGDYLFIQFAHNDEKQYDTSRYTDPYTTYQYYLSIYIDSARAHGAIPVLLTPINRNKWVDSTTLKDTHGDYPPAMRQLASEKDVPLIDITQKTKTLFESLGERYCTDSIFMDIPAGIYPGYPNGNTDNTHMQENGAFNICKLVIGGIREQDTNAIFSRLEPFIRKAVRIIAKPDTFAAGYIKGNGVFSVGDQTILTAIPNKGYAFSYWTHNGQTVSHNTNYTVTADSTGNVYIAHYIKTYQVTLNSSPTRSGLLFGSGYYTPDSLVTIIAKSNNGYRFISWSEGGEVVSTYSSYTFTMGTTDVEFNALFETTSAIKNISRNKEVRIFPNPASTAVHIQSASLITNVELFASTGEKISGSEYNSPFVNLTTEISALPAGLYLCRISTPEQTITRKIQIVR